MRLSARLFDATVLVTDARDGNFRPPETSDVDAARVADERRRAIVDRPWTFVRQVHGSVVHVVNEPTGPLEIKADALVSNSPGVALAVLGADCALVGLASAEGVIGAVHAGWRGLVAGVVEQSAAQMRALGATAITAAVGPFVRKECYPFQEGELEIATRAFGQSVRSRGQFGQGQQDSLDMEVALCRALLRSGIVLTSVLGGCTCDEGFYSERARHDRERHCLVVSSGED
jgi:YfiH family protein